MDRKEYFKEHNQIPKVKKMIRKKKKEWIRKNPNFYKKYNKENKEMIKGHKKKWRKKNQNYQKEYYKKNKKQYLERQKRLFKQKKAKEKQEDFQEKGEQE